MLYPTSNLRAVLHFSAFASIDNSLFLSAFPFLPFLYSLEVYYILHPGKYQITKNKDAKSNSEIKFDNKPRLL